MEEILHHLGCIKPCTKWNIYHINRCRIFSINSTTQFMMTLFWWLWHFVIWWLWSCRVCFRFWEGPTFMNLKHHQQPTKIKIQRPLDPMSHGHHQLLLKLHGFSRFSMIVCWFDLVSGVVVGEIKRKHTSNDLFAKCSYHQDCTKTKTVNTGRSNSPAGLAQDRPLGCLARNIWHQIRPHVQARLPQPISCSTEVERGNKSWILVWSRKKTTWSWRKRSRNLCVNAGFDSMLHLSSS